MLAQNIKYLRKKEKLSQQDLATELGIPRTTLGDYERGNTEPNIELMVAISKFFEVTIDELLTEDLSHKELEIIKNKNMRILAISVDADKKNNIELVDVKAEAGYLESFQDPQFIKELPKINFPNIPQGTFRGFEIQGDSMLPMEPGSIVICEYVERLDQIKNNNTYVVIGRDEGIVYKRVLNIPEENRLMLMSDNEVYYPYELRYEEVGEIWKYYAHLSFSDAKVTIDNMIEERLLDIQKRVHRIEEYTRGS